MEKVLNIELSKILNDKFLLNNINTKYNWYYHQNKWWYIVERINHLTLQGIKTLSLEEIIPFISLFWNEKALKYLEQQLQITNNLDKRDIEFFTKILNHLLLNKLLRNIILK